MTKQQEEIAKQLISELKDTISKKKEEAKKHVIDTDSHFNTFNEGNKKLEDFVLACNRALDSMNRTCK